MSFFCSAFPSKPVRKWASTALRRVESVPSAQFSVLLAGPHPEGKEAGAFTAKEALKPLPKDRLLTRMQESKLQTPNISQPHIHVHAQPQRSSAHLLSFLCYRCPPFYLRSVQPGVLYSRTGEVYQARPGLAWEECFCARGRGGPSLPGGSGARRRGRLSSRPGNIWRSWEGRAPR